MGFARFGLNQNKVYLLAAIDEEGAPYALGWRPVKNSKERGSAIWSSADKVKNFLANEEEQGTLPAYFFTDAKGNTQPLADVKGYRGVAVGWSIFEGFLGKVGITRVAINPRAAKDPKALVYHLDLTKVSRS